MSKIEMNVNEMDAAEMLQQHRERHPDEQGRNTEAWAAEMIREFDAEARAWHRRQGWDAFGLALLSCVTAISCGAALVGAVWQPIVAGIGVVNMMLTGAWLHKAKAGWDA